MDFVSILMPTAISWFFNVTALLLSLYVISTIDWLEVYRNGVFNVWLVTVFCIGLLWMIRATLQTGLNIHLSGTMLLTLMFGWRLGVIGMSTICLLVSLWGNSLLENIGISVFITAYFSITICYLIFLTIEAFLPLNLYIYLFITSFFGAMINFIIAGTVSASILVILDKFPWSTLLEQYLPFYYLMSFAEAFMTCGLITLMIVYRPQWVYTFRDKRYLVNK